jgi:osmotically-inducible protein OsmY
LKSDLQLRQDVLDELSADPSIDAAQIAVTVKDGIVTLAGDVSSYPQKRAAERAVKRVAGVKGYAEEIQVKLLGFARRTDADIARAAVGALEWDISVPADAITVKVHDGVVTLEGQVGWHFERQAAHDAVRHLLGVKRVANDIVVKPEKVASEVKNKIESAFARNALVDAGGISVSVESDTVSDTVTLQGTVGSWAARDEAERAAWAVPGVVFVDNRLAVR